MIRLIPGQLINYSKLIIHQVYCLQRRQVAKFSGQTYTELIKENTLETRDHLTPEISLRLITPRSRLWTAREHQLPFPDPFWAFYWPGGQILTRYLLDHPSVVNGKCIVDIGSGCGASAIAAKISGASKVTANDTDKVAVEAIALNAEINQVDLNTSTENLIGKCQDEWDVVLLGDMFYDDNFADVIGSWVPELSERGKTILIGDPGRYSFERHPLKNNLCRIYKHKLPENCLKENNGMTHGFVWKYCPRE
ncbi:hypothetical protein FSP39_004344 [Pinctada imbricata]|uniref:ETFB lysine methyltransferase n=1 Tax=Pinctada imbricata TaxID=66713 RepID=A0AA88XF26_PINIB|nr:hypothetical protein FSP39_004344 [Pinctada imbricata]